MRLDDGAVRRRSVAVGEWAVAICLWLVGLHLAPGVPRAIGEAAELAARYALGRS